MASLSGDLAQTNGFTRTRLGIWLIRSFGLLEGEVVNIEGSGLF